MKRFGRKLLYAFLLALWLIVLLLPVGMFRLARNGEMQIRNTRVFLVTERSQQGVGFQTSKPASNDANCTRSQLRYLMWEGESDNASTCYCTDGIEREPLRRQCVLNE